MGWCVTERQMVAQQSTAVSECSSKTPRAAGRESLSAGRVLAEFAQPGKQSLAQTIHRVDQRVVRWQSTTTKSAVRAGCLPSAALARGDSFAPARRSLSPLCALCLHSRLHCVSLHSHRRFLRRVSPASTDGRDTAKGTVRRWGGRREGRARGRARGGPLSSTPHWHHRTCAHRHPHSGTSPALLFLSPCVGLCAYSTHAPASSGS